MRAARLHGRRDVRIEEVPTPQPGPGQVLLRVQAVAICPSDWRLYEDGHAGGVVPNGPLIQGHEFSGEVVALGEGLRSPGVGVRVAVEPSWPCGRCDLCARGLTNICRHVVFPSFPPHDGALAEFIACPAACTHPLPESVGPVEGALVEPLGVAMHAVRLAGSAAGEEVAVLGAGLIGLSVLQLQRLWGAARIGVAEPAAGRLEWARRLGADPAVSSSEALARTGFEPEVVFECSGEAEGLDQAIALARPGGRVVVVGIPRVERVTFDMSRARRHELTVLFSRRSRNTLAEAVSLMASREVDFAALPVRLFPLEQTAAALEATAARPGDMFRAIVTP